MLTGTGATEAGSAGGGRRRCAVLGSPVGHSLSPVLHRAAYRELGLDWEYDAVEVGAGDLPGFLAGLGPRWRGLSLTMPLKRSVLPLLGEMSPTARRTGVVNTVLLEDDGRRVGHNTDETGIRHALAERGVTEVRDAVVVGGGATAASAAVALAGMGCRRLTLRVREPSRARHVVDTASGLGDALEVHVAGLREPLGGDQPADVVVSTVPAAAQQGWERALAERAAAVFDVVYDPWPTPLAAAAAAAGSTLVGGLDLLVHQATGQVELMTGCPRAPLAAMRAAGEAALARTAGQGF